MIGNGKHNVKIIDYPDKGVECFSKSSLFIGKSEGKDDILSMILQKVGMKIARKIDDVEIVDEGVYRRLVMSNVQFKEYCDVCFQYVSRQVIKGVCSWCNTTPIGKKYLTERR